MQEVATIKIHLIATLAMVFALSSTPALAQEGTLSIGGRTLDTSRGPVGGIPIAVMDLDTRILVTGWGYYTGVDGSYLVTGLTRDHTYSVSAPANGCTFTPERIVIRLTESVLNADFIGTCLGIATITGRVTDNAGRPLFGVRVALTGGNTNNAVTSAAGAYSIQAAVGNSITLTPSYSSQTIAGCTFVPSSRFLTNLPQRVVSQDFVATCTPHTYVISGSVRLNTGSPLPGVTMTLTGGTAAQNVQTGPAGAYQFAAAAGLSYTLAPSRAGCRFAPPIWSMGTLSSSQGGIVFEADCTVAPSVSYGFVPTAPCRVVDTRAGMGKAGAFGPPALSGGVPREISIPQSTCNIPPSAKVYSLNFTVLPRGVLSYLSTWSGGQPQPLVSTLNSFHGGVVSNAALVPAGVNGAINVLVTEPADVAIDINGYFDSPANALDFYPLAPCRLADTRGGFSGMFGPPSLSAGTSRLLPLLSSSCGIPVTAGAFSLNATVVPSGPLGYLSLFPAGPYVPLVSTLNSSDGAITANAAIVRAGNGGAISAYATDRTDLVLDIHGYFGPPSASGLKFYPTTPCRVADTRSAQAPILAAGSTRQFSIAGACGIPAAAQVYSLNVTVVPAGPLAYLTLWPAGHTQPLVSTLNSPLARTLANAAIVQAGTGGAVSVFATNTTHVILDVNGYFAP